MELRISEASDGSDWGWELVLAEELRLEPAEDEGDCRPIGGRLSALSWVTYLDDQDLSVLKVQVATSRSAIVAVKERERDDDVETSAYSYFDLLSGQG